MLGSFTFMWHTQCRKQNFLSSSSIKYSCIISRTAVSAGKKIRPLSNKTSVIVIGGGPTGLLLSALLTQYGIPSILLEARQPDVVARHPQAHYINLRSMEILRHSFPNLYHNILRNMPPLTEWNAFTFSHSILGRQIARVLHPVEDLKIGQDGNGVLSQEAYSSIIKNKMDTKEFNSVRVSPCHTPGHLAQNIFSKLLLDEARTTLELFHSSSVSSAENGATADILHGVTVTNIVDHGLDHGSFPISVHTLCGRQFQSKYVVAADGSSSLTRSLHGDTDIMIGQRNMQHLINVHFQTSPALSSLLMKQHDRIGMLHFVYNSNVVGAFVCHNLQLGHWVLQVPFFPPFDSVEDFTEEKVIFLVKSGIFGHDNNDVAISDLKIRHVKPWAMSALVSKSFLLGKSKRIILAGDAAHVFPPAGGFGMNTGLQDSHNLSWRLALLCENNNLKAVPKLLEDYERERKCIATINSALSIRNYNRTLEIAKACYLNADHPALLKSMMEMVPASLLPLSFRRDAFKFAVRTALNPLSDLAKEGTFLGERIVRNVRRILESGGGLPLLFPRFELGFSYDLDKKLSTAMNDTEGYIPSLSVGSRLPHLELDLVGRFGRISHEAISETLCLSPKNGSIEDRQVESKDVVTLSLTDLESQLSMRWLQHEKPHFLLLLFEKVSGSMIESPSSAWSVNVSKTILSEFNISLDIMEIFEDLERAATRLSFLDRIGNHSRDFSISIMHDRNKVIRTLLEEAERTSSVTRLAFLVRPDGHIMYRLRIGDGDDAEERFYEKVRTNLRAILN